MSTTDAAARMRGYIQRVATGPELGKALTREQAADGIAAILRGEIDEVRSAVFLIALRMKRETDDENLGALDALMAATQQGTVNLPRLLAVADPFNGYCRGIPATAFLPAVLASCGLPTYCHGVLQAGPKYGITIHAMLSAAGFDCMQDVESCAENIAHPGIGWAYLDQSRYCPGLHNLIALRDAMVKRSLLSTLEVVLRPLNASGANHLLTGFVHKAYPPVYAALAKHAGFDSALLVRGVEGGSIPSLSQVSRLFEYDGKALTRHRLSPRSLAIRQSQRMAEIPENMRYALAQAALHQPANAVAEYAAAAGMDALGGQPGPIRDSLIYGAAIALNYCGVADSLQAGALLAKERIDSQAALARFKAALCK